MSEMRYGRPSRGAHARRDRVARTGGLACFARGAAGNVESRGLTDTLWHLVGSSGWV